jgi:hypothetical protein
MGLFAPRVRFIHSMTTHSPGTRAPELLGQDLHGNAWTLSNYQGRQRVVLVLMRGVW